MPTSSNPRETDKAQQSGGDFFDNMPACILLTLIIWITLPVLGRGVSGIVERVTRMVPSVAAGVIAQSSLAPLFTDEVDYWSDDIERWAGEHELEPNLVATVMQIESCGHPTVSSHAGAQGLFQVMPFHFESGEDYLEPGTNARRGLGFLKQCHTLVGGDVGMTLACYNGGPSVIYKDWALWPGETRRYSLWGVGIYEDAIMNRASSATLDDWLKSGGSQLCLQATEALKRSL